jgi:hypothetical protein
VFLEEPQWTGLATYRRDVTHTSTVGGLITVREGAGYHNRVGSVDAFFRPLPSLRVQLQVAGSDTRYPDAPGLESQPAGDFTGSLISAQARLDRRDLVVNAGYRRQDGGFRADAGFNPMADVAQHWVWGFRRWTGTSASAISELRVAGGAWYDNTTAGELVTRGVWTNFVVQGPWQSRVWINPRVREERFAGQDFGVSQLYVGASASPSRWLSANFVGNIGTVVDYTNACPARQLGLEPSVTLRPGRRFETRLSYASQRLDTHHGERVLDAGVAQARVVYNFSHRVFVRAIVQHRLTDRDPATHTSAVAPLQESALSQLLFSYKVNPQTMVFLGYSDDRTGLMAADGSRTSLAPVGRTFFFKVGYALRP